MSNIGKNAAQITFAQMLVIIISIIASMLLSRFRTVTEYGTYSQLNLSISIVVAVFSLGLPNSINYFLARAETPAERKNFLSVYFTLSTLLSIVMGIILVAALPWIKAYFQNDRLSEFAYFLAIIPWTKVTISGISNILVVYGKTKKLMLVNIITSLLTLLSVIAIKIFQLSFQDYITALLISQVSVSVWIYCIVNRLESRLQVLFNWALIKKVFSYAIPIGLAALVGTINVEIDKLMIGNLMGTDALAIYTNAGKELPFTIIATSLTAVLLPQMAKLIKQDKPNEAVDLWGYSIRISYVIICFAVTALVVFAPQIMTILYSKKYLLGVQVFRVYSVVLILRTTYFGLMLNSTGKTKFILYSSILTMVLNSVLNYCLYLILGFVGPAIATFISILLTACLQLVMTSKQLNVSMRRLFPWKKLAQTTVINVAWGVPVYIGLKVINIGVSVKEILICIAIGLIITIGYVFVMYQPVRNIWRKLNENKQVA